MKKKFKVDQEKSKTIKFNRFKKNTLIKQIKTNNKNKILNNNISKYSNNNFNNKFNNNNNNNN